MKEGKGRTHHFAIPVKINPVGDLANVDHNVAVGQNSSFGKAGRAARILKQTGIGGRDGDRFCRGSFPAKVV